MLNTGVCTSLHKHSGHKKGRAMLMYVGSKALRQALFWGNAKVTAPLPYVSFIWVLFKFPLAMCTMLILNVLLIFADCVDIVSVLPGACACH